MSLAFAIINYEEEVVPGRKENLWSRSYTPWTGTGILSDNAPGGRRRKTMVSSSFGRVSFGLVSGVGLFYSSQSIARRFKIMASGEG